MNRPATRRLATWAAIALGPCAAHGQPAAAEPSQEVRVLAPVTVQGSRNSQLGIADSANAGVVTQQQLEARTVYRPGEMLEATPGLIVSQHSGEGKANQFYLRGFNLDHGTDFRTTVDGMRVNQRSHSHGQGWTDLNFMIPELATRLDYRKGPYYAAEGDFASAGAAAVRYADRLEHGIASVGIGQNGYRRVLLADSPAWLNGRLLYALELFRNDGPFVHPDDYRKFNGVLRYSEGTEANGFNITAMAYRARWNATDQIARRALDSGAISRFDTLDSSDGGVARRYSLSGAWRNSTTDGSTEIKAYLIRHQLDLYSNFTYFLDDPVHGDQFNQPDRRVTAGASASRMFRSQAFGRDSETTVGVQLENDNAFNGLYRTERRQRLSTTREDHIVESSIGLFAQNTTYWNDKFRTTAGVRADRYRFKVASSDAANTGRVSAGIANPQLALVFGPWARTEYYVNMGSGFHSNDARGTTIRIDPGTGDPADRVPGLVRSKGAELGVRTEFIPNLQSAFSVYQLNFDSELVFAGDAGTTEAGRPSRRVGFEFSNYYKPTRWLTVDADIAFARARFRDVDPAVGQRIPGAIEGVASLALAVDKIGPWYGALQLRYFGPRPLVEDNSVRSRSTATLNGRIGYQLTPSSRIELEGFNLANRKASAIDYYYRSRLASEAVAVNDVHFHPIERRSFRVNYVFRFN